MLFKRHQRPPLDMCSGPMLGNMFRFAMPIMASGLLQQFYNTMDMTVVGQFAGKEALAAVGSTGSLIALIVNLFMGLSVGASVAVARAWGARDHERISQATHTAITTAGLCGFVLILIGFFFAKTCLIWMGTPADVLPGATLYVQIYFAGMPFNLVYNFGSAILRASGDSKRSLYFLAISGLVNVLLNLLFVIGFHMSVDGVALATVISQAVSAVLVIQNLRHATTSIRLQPRRLRIHKEPLLEMIRIGVPSGIQASLLSLSNVLIQSTLNSFGSTAIAGNSAAANLENYLWTSMNGFHQANTTFTSQNLGAKHPERVRRAGYLGIGLAAATGILAGFLLNFGGPTLLALYNSDPAVIETGMVRLRILAPFCCFSGLYNGFAVHLRGMGYSVYPMFASMIGICLFRTLWLYTFFAASPTLNTLYWVFPLSMLLSTLLLLPVDLHISYRVMPRKIAQD